MTTISDRFALIESMSPEQMRRTMQDVVAFGWVDAMWFAEVRK